MACRPNFFCKKAKKNSSMVISWPHFIFSLQASLTMPSAVDLMSFLFLILLFVLRYFGTFAPVPRPTK